MRRTISIVLIGTACFASPCKTYANDKAVKARVSFATFPPWSFKDSLGHRTGIMVEYLRDLAQDVGLQLQEEDIPIARFHNNMRQGKIDLFFSRVPAKGFDCCISLGKAFDSDIVVIGRKNGPTWNPAQPDGQSVCRTGLSGYSLPGFRMFDAGSLDTCARMVARERLPFLIGERHSLMKILQEQKAGSINFSEPEIIEKQDFHLFVSGAIYQTALGPLLRKAVSNRPFVNYLIRFIDTKR